MGRRHASAGFSLLELIVALSLSALVVLIAHRLLSGIGDGVSQLEDATASLDRDMNARRWLAEAFGSLDVGLEAGSFAGHRESVEFTTGQIVPGGWLERRRISLARSRDSFVASVDRTTRIALAHDLSSFDVDYLLDPGANTPWVREWLSAVSAPLAVRLRVGYGDRVDTLLLLIGPRG